MPQLSNRLKLIFDQLIPGEPVWDLCCDHGYLGLAAYDSAAFPVVYFVDQVPEIIQRLEDVFVAQQKKPESAITTKFMTASAEELSEKLTGNVVIAGVGSYTVFKILKALHSKNLLLAKRLILCPQNAVIKISDIENLPGFKFRQVQQPVTVFENERQRTVFVLDSHFN